MAILAISTTARARGRNILHQQGGTKRFIWARVDTAPDIFFELFGQQSFSMIQARTLEKAKLQNDDEFQLSIDKLHAFVGLCIIRGEIKGRVEPLHSFWDTDYGRRIFTETMSRNKFLKILRFIRFDDKRTRPRRRENDKYAPIRDLWKTVMNNVEKSFFHMAKSQLMNNYFLVDQGAVLFNTCSRSLPNLASNIDYCVM